MSVIYSEVLEDYFLTNMKDNIFADDEEEDSNNDDSRNNKAKGSEVNLLYTILNTDYHEIFFHTLLIYIKRQRTILI